MRVHTIANFTTILFAMCGVAAVSAEDGEPVRVTVDNFRRAESDHYFARFVKDGGFGKFKHERELAPIERQTVIRLNRDTLYSFGVFDLDAGSVTLTLPDAGERYMAVQIIDQDHYVPDVFYAPKTRRLSKEEIGTRYVCLAVRTFVDPNDPADIKAVHALQDAIKVEQTTAGTFEVPDWDPESLTRVREALLALASANGGIDSARMFGKKDEVDPVQHLIGTAAGWGGNPSTAALYAGIEPEQNDGQTVYRLTVKDVPVDGFWSVTVYDKNGFMAKNDLGVNAINNVTGAKEADGSYLLQFGGCDGSVPNCIPVTEGWNYAIRLYRPHPEVVNGTWTAPEAVVKE